MRDIRQWRERLAVASQRNRTEQVQHYSVTTRMSLGREMSVFIDLNLLYVDRTDAIYQFIQRNLLADPHYDQTICRNPFILHARQRCE